MSTIRNQSTVQFCCPTTNQAVPNLELFMGERGTQAGRESGIFLRINNPEAIKPGDVVYARHRANRNVQSHSNTRQEKTRVMRMINGQGTSPDICPWWANFQPITNVVSLSKKMGPNEFRWVKVKELNILEKCIRKPGKFYWAGNHGTRSEYSDGAHHGLWSGKYRNFTSLDFVVVRDGKIISKSQQYLLCAYGHTQQGANHHVDITFREIGK